MISDDDFRSRMDEERNREVEVKNQIQSFKPQEEVHADLTDIKYVLIDIKRNWSELEDTEKKALVQSIVKQVHVGYIEKVLTAESVDYH
ncbi:hypothetical protein [Peribacillus sp. FSL R5-0717]|uniref:hypothetical protein n=1 Tax=Peribacillus sp. FSL R5-0717 TaxID=2975308 RepID=UPI0030F98967